MSEQDVQSIRTYCRVCMVHCGIIADVAGDQIVKIRGDREHPLTKGYTCPKGRATDRIHHDPRAITRPLMRKNGELVPVSWDEALDDIGAKLKRVIETHGPHAIGINFGSGMGLDSAGYMMEEALYHALQYPPKFSPLTIDGTAKVMISGAMAQFPGFNAKTDYDNVDMLLYIGTNPMVSHAHNTGMYNPAEFIRAAAARGEVWTIDPVLTETAKWSTRHIAPYPGSDYAILAWLVREVLDGGPFNPAQPIQQFDELRAALDGFTRATAAEIAGVPEQDLQDLLDAIRRKGRVTVEVGTGVTMTTTGNVSIWFAWTLMVLTGAMNRVGGAWFHPGFLNQMELAPELPIMDPWTPGSKTRPDVLGVLGDWPCAVLPDEIEAGNIRALFNFGGSIMRSFPDTNRLKESLEKLEFNVVTEIIANETTDTATHVLPTKGAVERAEIQRWDTLAWNVAMQYTPPLVRPLGERRSGWWVIGQIMQRAGLKTPDHMPDDDHQGADEAMMATLFPYARASFEDVKAKRYIEFPLEFPGAWVDRHIERIGGWRLAHPNLVEQWTRFRAADEALLGKPRSLVYSSRRQRKKLNAALDFLGAPADILLHPDDASAHNIQDGEKVRVHNTRGEIVLTAKVDPTMRRGVVSIPHGHSAANVNFLTSTDIVDELGGMALYSGVAVDMEPVS